MYSKLLFKAQLVFNWKMWEVITSCTEDCAHFLWFSKNDSRSPLELVLSSSFSVSEQPWKYKSRSSAPIGDGWVVKRCAGVEGRKSNSAGSRSHLTWSMKLPDECHPPTTTHSCAAAVDASTRLHQQMKIMQVVLVKEEVNADSPSPLQIV